MVHSILFLYEVSYFLHWNHLLFRILNTKHDFIIDLIQLNGFNNLETVLLGLCSILCVTAIIFRPRKLKLNLVEQSLQTKSKTIANLEPESKTEVDITIANLAAGDLRNNILFMQQVAELAPNLIYVYDLEKQCNVYANRYVWEILNYSTAEIDRLNTQLLDILLHPDDIKTVESHHQKCLFLKSDQHLEVEYRTKDGNGNWHWLKSKDTVFKRDDMGKPTQILGIARDVTESKNNQIELTQKIAALEAKNRERIYLGKMNHFLQSCLTIDEATKALKDLLLPLFPNTNGIVYLLNDSRNLFEQVAVWGQPRSKNNFEPKECWAIRQGNIHLVNPNTPGLYCIHSLDRGRESTLCLPTIAQGDTLGAIYIDADEAWAIDNSVRELAETVAQNIALAVSNLRLQEKLVYQSLRDTLTGLFNRRYLKEYLVKEVNRAQRKQQFISILMMDIDHFKRFNDTYGHSAGDLVLKEVGAFLLSQVREYDTACRYGGEELVIVMPDAGLDDAVIRAETIREGIKKLKLKHEGEDLEAITVSIGVSCFPDDGINAEDLIRAADRALYQAKEDGRNCVRRS